MPPKKSTRTKQKKYTVADWMRAYRNYHKVAREENRKIQRITKEKTVGGRVVKKKLTLADRKKLKSIRATMRPKMNYFEREQDKIWKQLTQQQQTIINNKYLP